MNRPRVLLSAYQCAPGGGSVSQIGWEWYSRLSTEAQVTLVTHTRNRPILERSGAPLAGSRIIYIDTEWFAGPLYRLASVVFPRSEHAVFLLASIDFFVFDAAALKRVKRCRLEFDLIHAVTPVSPLAVTRLHKLGIPLVVGPWNGGMNTLGGFQQVMRSDSEWIYRARFLRGILDRIAGCTRKASRVLSATTATDRCLPDNVASERMIENGVDLELFYPEAIAPPSPSNPLRILFVGRLIPAKGLSMLLTAAARIRSTVPIEIAIIGSGSIRESLEAQVKRERLEDVVHFHGAESQARIAELLRLSHLFCLPSIRESGGAVLLEAMASGIPVLTVAHGGPGELIDEEVGRSLAADGPETLIQGLADSLTDVYRNPEAWAAKGRNGRLCAERLYGWRERVRKVVDLYHCVIREKDERSRSQESRHNRARLPSPEHID